MPDGAYYQENNLPLYFIGIYTCMLEWRKSHFIGLMVIFQTAGLVNL